MLLWTIIKMNLFMKRFNLFIIIFLGLCLGVFSQEKEFEPPRLVVGVKIEGLQPEHIQQMWKYFTPDGFRKIVSESVVVKNVMHNIVSAGNSADMATIMTGSFPFYHGVSGDYFYSRLDDQTFSVLYDKNERGIGTKEKYSARRLLCSTFTDEIRMKNSLSQVHSIAINPEDAIMMGGHNATSVTWIDDVSNRWATSTYYERGLSRWADMMNAGGKFNQISSERWSPSGGITTYLNPTLNGSRSVPFSYYPTEKLVEGQAQTMLKFTPAANTLVTELAKSIFDKEQLGVDKYTDILMLQFNLKISNQVGTELNYAEQEDMYIRLDRNLQDIISLINSRIGEDKVLYFFLGSSMDVHSPVELGKNQIPAGFFNADRALALLNTYLMAVYGQEKWISGYYGKNVFLNKKKIEEKKLDLKDFKKRVTDFLIEFEGVQSAYSTTDILNFSGDKSDVRAKFRNSYHKNTSGDISISLMPGWIEVDNKGRVVGDANSPQQFFPFYIMQKNLPSVSIDAVYNSTDIAPTISSLLGIPFPNASVGNVIQLTK